MFTQTYGATALDASLLLVPLMGFLPASDPRVRATVLAIADELTEDGLVLRYRPHEADDGVSAAEEGSFTICSFWLVSALARIGEADRARALFDRLVAFASPLGLFAEEIEPATGRHLGNTPQAFSHLALIGAALDLRPRRRLMGTVARPGTLSPMRVPGFLVRQLYVAGSLRNHTGGFSLQARNSIGDGWLDGIGAIRVDGHDIPLADISATREGDPTVYRAIDVTPQTPVVFRRGDVVTFWIAGLGARPGRPPT